MMHLLGCSVSHVLCCVVSYTRSLTICTRTIIHRSTNTTHHRIQGHAPGKNPTLKLENVVISKDRIGFTVVTDAEKHARALLDKKLVATQDVSVQPILSPKRCLTIKPPASQELMDRLRENSVPFRAASTKGANTAGNVARFSVFLLYVLFLRRMYQAMGGGGGAGASGGNGPGKLATFSKDEPLVKFEDIEGIDDAKFEVMELVDTLRNPKKYEVSFW